MKKTFDPDRYFRGGEWLDATDQSKNHYERLGLRFDDNPSLVDIRESFLKMFEWWGEVHKKYISNPANPKTKDTGPASIRALNNLSVAKDILSDHEKRGAYDEQLLEEVNDNNEEEFRKAVQMTLKGSDLTPDIKRILQNWANTYHIESARAEEIILAEARNLGILKNPIVAISPDNSPSSNRFLAVFQKSGNSIQICRVRAFNAICFALGACFIPLIYYLTFYKETTCEFRFRRGLTMYGFILGSLSGLLIFYLKFIHEMNQEVALIAGIIGVVIIASKFGYQHSSGISLVLGIGIFIGGFIMLGAIQRFPIALSIVAWAVAYGGFALNVALPVHKAILQKDKYVPIISGVGVIGLTAILMCFGFLVIGNQQDFKLVKLLAKQKNVQPVMPNVQEESGKK